MLLRLEVRSGGLEGPRSALAVWRAQLAALAPFVAVQVACGDGSGATLHVIRHTPGLDRPKKISGGISEVAGSVTLVVTKRSFRRRRRRDVGAVETR